MSLRKQMLCDLAVPIVFILLASFFVIRKPDALSHSIHVSVDSAEAIGLRHALLISVLDAETGLRGYLLAGDPQFLQPYASARHNFDAISQQLQMKDAARPMQLRRLYAVDAREIVPQTSHIQVSEDCTGNRAKLGAECSALLKQTTKSFRRRFPALGSDSNEVGVLVVVPEVVNVKPA